MKHDDGIMTRGFTLIVYLRMLKVFQFDRCLAEVSVSRVVFRHVSERMLLIYELFIFMLDRSCILS